MLTVYCWLLCLYPRSYRHDFGEEMTLVPRDARNALPPGLAVKISSTGANFVDSCPALCVRTKAVVSYHPAPRDSVAVRSRTVKGQQTT